MTTVPHAKVMRHAIILLTISLFAASVQAQLISTEGHIAVEVASDVPKDLRDIESLSFDHLEMFFDGGSHGAIFNRSDGEKLVLLFPHCGYWTSAALKARTQPIAALTRRDGKQVSLRSSKPRN